MDTVKEALPDFSNQSVPSSETCQSWWLNPTGDRFRVPFQWHSKVAGEILQAYPDRLRAAGLRDPQFVLYDMGWVAVRIFLQRGDLVIEHSLNMPITDRQMKELEKMADKYNDDPEHENKIYYVIDKTSNNKKISLGSSGLFQEIIDPQKQQLIKQYLPHLTTDNIFISVQKIPEIPNNAADYVQIDGVVNGRNIFSTNAEEMTAAGYPLPTTRELLQKLPHGKYKLTDLKTRGMLEESMFPKGYNRHLIWGCGTACEHATRYLLKKGRNDFKVIAGNVSVFPEMWKKAKNPKHRYCIEPHIWIEFDNGRIFDPSKKQFDTAYGSRFIKYRKKGATVFTPEEFLVDRKKMHLLKRGIVSEGMINERLTFADLYDDTDDERIFKSKLPGMRVRPMAISMENGNETWNFGYTSQEKAQYKRHGGKVGHRGRIIFFKDSVEPQDNAEDLECMVDCDCKDFQFRFAYVNAQDDASMVGPDSLNKAINRPPIKTNPEGHQQLCKHLAALVRYLTTNIDRARERAYIRRRPMNIFEAMDEITKKGKDNWQYFDKDESLNETRVIDPEQSLESGFITLYHGTTWPLALKAKKGELGPQDMKKLILDVLVNVYHETPEAAEGYYTKHAGRRDTDPPSLFLTTSKSQAEGYARSATKWGGELFYDVLSGYLWSKNKRANRDDIMNKLRTTEPALVTVTVPLEMVFTHPNWTTPLKSRIRDIIVTLKKYPDIKDALINNFQLEVFVKEKIPRRFVERIDRVEGK